ncbi:GlcG/HbpS family heme-binding protein [Microlunatus elymi]|uniref:GlcG/HbpS family heme-binding protein n=1 Tax=Microlunatus elymi TaxID=2596828 RepID=UPI001AEFF01D|nr:heme-binding protein [Microlunatus elymi]
MKKIRFAPLAAAGVVLGLTVVGCATAASADPADRGRGADKPATPVTVAKKNTVTLPRVTDDAAMTAARAALTQCKADGLGFVSVSVVDRAGQLQAFVRGDTAAQHTIESSRLKAYTAAAFGADTSDLVERADKGGLRDLPDTLFLPGGVSVKQGKASIAGIGVAGAPDGMLDQKCAAAGLAAIAK